MPIPIVGRRDGRGLPQPGLPMRPPSRLGTWRPSQPCSDHSAGCSGFGVRRFPFLVLCLCPPLQARCSKRRLGSGAGGESLTRHDAQTHQGRHFPPKRRRVRPPREASAGADPLRLRRNPRNPRSTATAAILAAGRETARSIADRPGALNGLERRPGGPAGPLRGFGPHPSSGGREKRNRPRRPRAQG